MDSDKSIIIDGVNVKECISYAEQHGKGAYETIYNYCHETKTCCGSKDNYNCHFKQIKRLEAEKKDLINYFELREGGMQEDIYYWKNKAQNLYRQLQDNITKNEEIRSHCQMNNEMPIPCFGNWVSKNELKFTATSTNTIPVDDVNVAECEFMSKEHSFTNPKGQCKIKLKDCKFVNNCYFKQIKQLEQAKEELQNLWANSTAERIKLEKENEKYKQIVKTLQEIVNDFKNEIWTTSNKNEFIDKINEVLNANSININ